MCTAAARVAAEEEGGYASKRATCAESTLGTVRRTLGTVGRTLNGERHDGIGFAPRLVVVVVVLVGPRRAVVSATDASDGDDVSPPVNPPRRLRRAPIGVFPEPTLSRVGVVPPGDSKDPSKDDRSPSDANGSSSAYACPRSGRVSGADRARESRRISFSRCRRPLGDVASGARVARRVGRVGVEADRSITGRPWVADDAFGPPTNSLSRRSLVAVALARILAIVASATGSENGVGVGVSSGLAASSASSAVGAPFSVVPSASGRGRRSTEGTERARGSAMPRAAAVFGGASGAVSGRGAFDTASAAMSESIDVAPGASLVSGVSISADGCGTARGLKTARGSLTVAIEVSRDRCGPS